MSNVISILGSRVSSLSAACYLFREGHNVTIYEKNKPFGGRATQLNHQGYKFDIGRSWHWMSDVFERFFADFDRTASDYYTLSKLDPGTPTQTAFLRHKIKCKKVPDLFFTEQHTVPCPDVPLALISDKIAAESISKHCGS